MLNNIEYTTSQNLWDAAKHCEREICNFEYLCQKMRKASDQ